MRNNFLKILIFFLINCNFSFADQFIFETSKIDILNDGNLVIAGEGKAETINKELIINAKKFEYEKDKKVLKAFDGKAYFKSYNLEIEFGEITSNQSTLITSAKNNVKVFDLKRIIN